MKSGLFGIIVANKWMRAGYGESLRKWFKKHNIINIIDFGDLPVFESATTYPCILVVKKNDEKNSDINITLVQDLSFANLNTYVVENYFKIKLSELEDSGWMLVNKSKKELLRKIETIGVNLEK